MTDTVVSDAVAFPQDEGIGTITDGNESWPGAGLLGALARYVDGVYVENGLTFTVDTANNDIDIAAGTAYVETTAVDVQSALGPSASDPPYDTTIPGNVTVALHLPTAQTNLTLGANVDNDIWLAYDTATGDVYIRHGTGLSEPGDPSVKLGTANTSTGETTRTNDGPSPDFNTVTVDNAELQSCLDGYVVPVGSGVGVGDAIDPSTTSTPVQDAIDVIGRANDGGVYLPPITINETGPIQGGKGKYIKGWGQTNSEIEFTSTTADGISQDSSVSADWAFSVLEDVQLTGGATPGSRTGGSALHFNVEVVSRCQLNRVNMPDWGGTDPIIHFNSAHPFDIAWPQVHVGSTVSDGNAFQIDNAGSPGWIGHMTLNTGGTGKAIEIQSSPQLTIENIEIVSQGSNFAAVQIGSGSGPAQYLRIGEINYESTTSLNSVTDSAIVYKQGPGYVDIDSIQIQGSGVNANYGFVDQDGNGEWEVEKIGAFDTATYNSNYLRLHTDINGGEVARYGGSISEFDDGTGVNNLTDGGIFFQADQYFYQGSNLTGSTTLSAGNVVIDTGVTSATATLDVAYGTSTSNSEIAYKTWYNGTSHQVEFFEDGTSVGNPTVNYDITERDI